MLENVDETGPGESVLKFHHNEIHVKLELRFILTRTYLVLLYCYSRIPNLQERFDSSDMKRTIDIFVVTKIRLSFWLSPSKNLEVALRKT